MFGSKITGRANTPFYIFVHIFSTPCGWDLSGVRLYFYIKCFIRYMLGVSHPASRSFLNWTRRKGLYRNRVKSLLSMRKPLLGDVSKPGQLSLALLDAILIFVLKARFWPSPCQKYDPCAAFTGLTEVTISQKLGLRRLTVRRALPWPSNKVLYKLSANEGVRISLSVTPPCKVRTVVSWSPLHGLLSWRIYT